VADGPKTVTLVDPNGGEVKVSDAISVNSLVFGSGYKIKGGGTVEDAVASLAANVEAPAEAEKPAKK